MHKVLIYQHRDTAQIKSLMFGIKRKSDRKKSDENKYEEESGRMQITRNKKGLEEGKVMAVGRYFSYTQLQFKPRKTNCGKKSFTAKCRLEIIGASYESLVFLFDWLYSFQRSSQ